MSGRSDLIKRGFLGAERAFLQPGRPGDTSRKALLKAIDRLGARAYIAAPQHGPGLWFPGTRMCPPQLALQIEPESFATEARSDTAILTSEEQERDAQAAACRRGLPRELARLTVHRTLRGGTSRFRRDV